MFNSKLIYNIGLHNGDDTEEYLKRNYRVIAVEAVPVQVEKAKEKFSKDINNLNHCNFQNTFFDCTIRLL